MTRIISVRITKKLHGELKQLAQKEGKTLNAICAECLQGLADSEQVRTNHSPPASTTATTEPPYPIMPPTTKPTFTPKGF